jgi:hypothetical protein
MRSVLRFTAPANVAGTAFLMIQHQGSPDEQYIYLSRMKTTRRIAGTGDREAFMGSDFSYADLERKDLRDATYARQNDESIGADACFVLIATPKDGLYTKVVAWVRQKDYVPLRVQMFGKDGQLEKTSFTKRIKDMDGKPLVVETLTVNAKTQHETTLVLDDIKSRGDLDDALFTPAALAH